VFWIQEVQPTVLELWWLHKISFRSVTIWVLVKSKCHFALYMGGTKCVKQFVARNSCSSITRRGMNSMGICYTFRSCIKMLHNSHVITASLAKLQLVMCMFLCTNSLTWTAFLCTDHGWTS
jgi:hypothetical protein